jgi:hypothetical protein
VHECAAGHERVVQRRERVGGVARDAAVEVADRVVVTCGDVADPHALCFERRVELVAHDTAVAHDEHPGARAGFCGPRPAAGRTLVARCAQLLFTEGRVAREVELVDSRVAPDLRRRRRPYDRGQLLGRGRAPLREPPRPPQRTRRVDRERRGQLTAAFNSRTRV